MGISFWLKILYQVVKMFWIIIGGVWTLMEILKTVFSNNQFIRDCSTNIWILLIPAILLSTIYGIYTIYSKFFPVYKFDDKMLCIKIGNILKQKNGNILIGINEQLETSKDKIGVQSIHMQLLKENQKNEQQIKKSFDEFRKKNPGKRHGFFQADIGGKKCIFLIMSTIERPKAVSTSAGRIYEELISLLNGQEHLSINNHRVYVPLLGTGEAGVRMPKDAMILLIVSAFLRSCVNTNDKHTDKIKQVNIIVHYKDVWDINWYEVDKKIKILVEGCRNCKYLNYSREV